MSEQKHHSEPNMNWFSRQIKNSPFNAAFVFIGIPQFLILSLIGYYKIENSIISILYVVFFILAIGLYTAYASHLRGRTRLWGIGLLFGLVIISLIGIKGEKEQKNGMKETYH